MTAIQTVRERLQKDPETLRAGRRNSFFFQPGDERIDATSEGDSRSVRWESKLRKGNPNN